MQATGSQPELQGRRRHILLVDDDEAACAAYAKLLQNAGYDVSTASNFRVALDILEGDQALDLMLVDIVMPGSVNGLALSRMARLRRPDVQIIYVTGYNLPGVGQEALGPILRKPVEEPQLLGAVRQALEASQP